MKGLSKIFIKCLTRCLPEAKTDYVGVVGSDDPGLEREEQLTELATRWYIWDPTISPAPVGWVWLKDNVLDSWCLVRYSRGRLDRITRREWYKTFRRIHRKVRPVSREE